MKKSKDLIDFEKIRNYCNAPWISTRESLPEEGVPVLIAYHVKRNLGDIVHKGFEGYAVSIGARYIYREGVIDSVDENGNIKKTKLITCHLGTNISDDFNFTENWGAHSWRSVNYMQENRKGTNCYGIKDPYLRKNVSKLRNGSSYWIDISKGTYGNIFENTHSADRSYVPETTVKKMLNSKDRRVSCITIQNDAINSVTVCAPDFWMPIPALR